MDSTRLGEQEQFAIARWARFAGLDRRALHLADRHHLSRVRFGELAPTSASAAPTDPGEVFADMFLRLRHSLDPLAGVAPALTIQWVELCIVSGL